ncbi:MAG: hypothetical protein AB7I42_22685 [Bradyrhizobium sp.]|uniref:hypothetical protein n=1 Tax=Bradyrhizobium sp. TaxID=376 RepID=UPI003D09FA26
MTRLLILLALLCLPIRTVAQCLGDGDNDGAVSVAELVGAVANALNGCATGCRLNFQTSTFDDPGCGFIGPFNTTCGFDLVGGMVAEDGYVYIVLDTNPRIGFIGEATSPTTATLLEWSFAPYTNPHFIGGSLRLENGRRTVVIDPDTPTVTIGGCHFDTYRGAYLPLDGSGAAAAVDITALRALAAERR